MSDTPPVPTTEELTAQLATLRATLAKSLGLGEDADEAAILAAVGSTTKERDDAKARAASIEANWADEKVTRTLTEMLEKSGVKPEFMEDAMLRAKPLFTVDEKGRVVTRKDAPNTVPGVDPLAWIHGELKVKAARYWPTSAGGGAGVTGAGQIINSGGDDSCFDPMSPSYSWTKMLAAEAKFGSDFADRARAKYRGRGGR